VRFQFISAQKAHFSVIDLCNVVGVSTSGYYAWCKREPSKRELDDGQLLQIIKDLFKAHRETYGSPRIHDALKDLGHQVGENRVARIMRENGLSAHPKRTWRCVTTKARTILWLKTNLIVISQLTMSIKNGLPMSPL